MRHADLEVSDRDIDGQRGQVSSGQVDWPRGVLMPDEPLCSQARNGCKCWAEQVLSAAVLPSPDATVKPGLHTDLPSPNAAAKH